MGLKLAGFTATRKWLVKGKPMEMYGDNAKKHGESVKSFISFRPNVETDHTNTQATMCTVTYKVGEATQQL
jgi:hypothetical protein